MTRAYFWLGEAADAPPPPPTWWSSVEDPEWCAADAVDMLDEGEPLELAECGEVSRGFYLLAPHTDGFLVVLGPFPTGEDATAAYAAALKAAGRED